MKRKKIWVSIAAGALVVGATSVTLVALQPTPTQYRTPDVKRTTAEVVRGDLSASTLVQGQLSYTGERAVSGKAGTLTSRAAPGTTVSLGDELFAVDNASVALFTGSLPQWRPFESGMSDGPDVQQLEASLTDLGYFWGGADEVFDDDTRTGIKLWQEATDREVTGEIGLGDIHFAPSSVRVASAELAPGAPTAPGTTVLRVSELGKSVTVELKLSQQQLAAVGAAVEVELPGGAKTPGRITAVDPPRAPEKTKDNPSGDTTLTIPVTIALDTPEDASAIDRAPVRVSFTSETKKDVLSVPVGALLAMPGGGYGLEVTSSGAGKPKRVAVETGLYAGGLVEVTGKGLKAGDKVVIAES